MHFQTNKKHLRISRIQKLVGRFLDFDMAPRYWVKSVEKLVLFSAFLASALVSTM